MTAVVVSSELRAAVRRKFDAVASAPGDAYRFRVGGSLADDTGYPPDVLGRLPRTATEAFTGLAYLHPVLGLQSGERVLDLGCGAGVDSLIAAGAVGPAGAVVGVDLAAAMLARARRAAAEAVADHARFAVADAEALPFRDRAFDAVLVNGLLNLCPDKRAALAEIARVLQPGGRAVVAEIVVHGARVPAELRTPEDWFR